MGEYTRRGGVVVTLILAALILQGFYTVGSVEVPEGGEYGGTLKVGLRTEVRESDLNPITADDDEVWKVIDIVYDSLFRLKVVENNSVFPIPWIAEGWTVPDNNTVIVELKQGVEWHDSTEASPHYVTATDVVYTFNHDNGMKDSVRYGDLLTDLEASEIDSHNVSFNLSNFDNKGLFFTKVLTIPLVEENYIWGTSIERGCGPFKFKSAPTSSVYSVADEVIILDANGDETHASMKHQFVSNVTIYDAPGQTWDSSNYSPHYESGSIKLLSFPIAGKNYTADYDYVNKNLILESFDNYFYAKPYLKEIVYTFYPDNPDTEDFDEAADKAIIDLIRRNIDLIGFSLKSIEIGRDRYLDVATDEKTKLSEETWKTVKICNNWTEGTEADTEKCADDYIRDDPGKTLRKIKKWGVEEDILDTDEWTIIATFDSKFEAENYKEEILKNEPWRELRVSLLWLVQEFFLALEETAGFEVLYLGINTQKKPLDDQAFRFALTNLMDRNTHYSLLGTGKDIGYSLVIPENTYWYNDSIPMYKLEHEEEGNEPILAPINLLLELAGYLNMGSDGFRNLPTGEEFNLTLRIPSISTDPVESAIGSTIVNLLNQVGVNTTVYQPTWDEIEENVTNNNFDLAMGILETDMDPSFLYDLFHSSKSGNGSTDFTNIADFVPIKMVVNETLNDATKKIQNNMTMLAHTNLKNNSEIVYQNDTVWVDDGKNYTVDYETGILTVKNGSFDYTNDTLNITYEFRFYDHLLEMSNSVLGFGARQGYIKDLVGSVAEEAPIIPLVYYNTLEAYDRTVYDGWVRMPGGINNFWSYINLRYILTGTITIDVTSAFTNLKANAQTQVIVTAKNEEGAGIGGVWVGLSEAEGRGEIADLTGFTDSTGSFQTSYIAPDVTQPTDIELIAVGSAERYGVDYDQAEITIYPLQKRLVPDVDRLNTTLDSGGFTLVTVVVIDETGLPVGNASVKLEVTPDGLDYGISPSEGKTDMFGSFFAIFEANVTTETFFKITATATKEGYAGESDITSIKVLPLLDDDTGDLPILEIALIIIIVVLLVLLLIISFMGGKKKPEMIMVEPTAAEEAPERPLEEEELEPESEEDFFEEEIKKEEEDTLEEEISKETSE